MYIPWNTGRCQSLVRKINITADVVKHVKSQMFFSLFAQITLTFVVSFWLQLYTSCRCIPGSKSHARPKSCPNNCQHFLLPVMLVISLASLIACLTHNPMYMMVLRWGLMTMYYTIFIHIIICCIFDILVSTNNYKWFYEPLYLGFYKTFIKPT